jgi:hypothetical protein
MAEVGTWGGKDYLFLVDMAVADRYLACLEKHMNKPTTRRDWVAEKKASPAWTGKFALTSLNPKYTSKLSAVHAGKSTGGMFPYIPFVILTSTSNE